MPSLHNKLAVALGGAFLASIVVAVYLTGPGVGSERTATFALDPESPSRLVPEDGGLVAPSVRAASMAEQGSSAVASDAAPPPGGVLERDIPAIVAGVMTREQVGPQYDAIIRSLAQQQIDGVLTQGAAGRAATLVGFSNGEELESFLDTAKRQDYAVYTAFRALADAALVAELQIPGLMEQVWNNQQRVEVIDPNKTYDAASWRQQNFLEGPDGPKSLLKFAASARIGDRVFNAHFFSSDFPAFEAELANLESRKMELLTLYPHRLKRH